MTMKSTMTLSRFARSCFAVLACGLATSLHPSPSLAQDAEADDKPASETSKTVQGSAATKKSNAKTAASKSDEAEPEHVYKTEAEWRKLLTNEQFLVTRMKATEPAFSGRYAVGHPKGTFLCVCCGAKLFDSRTKFDSGTGWPSFWQPISVRAVSQALDRSEYEPRVEVMCSRCGAHLGHVFEDGPLPTGLRYCINSLSLKLDSEATRPTASHKTSSRGVRKRNPPATRSASKSSKGSTSKAASRGGDDASS